MKNTGLIVAVELDAVTRRYGEPEKKTVCGGFEVSVYRIGDRFLHVLNCGAGELSAAAGTQVLISCFGAELIVNFGVVGGLTPEMALARTCIVKGVVHYDFDPGAFTGTPVGQYAGFDSPVMPASPEYVQKALEICPELKPVICASADKFVEDKNKKAELHTKFGADICEMEAAGIVLTCHRNNVPCLLIKTVSDGLEGGFEEFSREIGRASDLCLRTVEEIIAGL